MRGGSNMPRVGDYNRILIVDLVRRHPGISRVELAERTGLRSQTVANICSYLADQGLIKESGRVQNSGSRPRTVYTIVPASRYAVGMHIDATRAVLGLVDLAGRIVDRTSLEMSTDGTPESQLDAFADSILAMITRNNVPPKAMAGLGVATPGPLRMDAGSVVDPPTLRGWDVVQLRDNLQSRLSMHVELEKDSVAAATGEYWTENAPSNNFLFVYLGTGSGTGVVLGGEVLHGASGNLGNFGHHIADPQGPDCPCGSRGCLGVTVMPSQLVARAVDLGVIEGPIPVGALEVERALTDVAQRARNGSTRAASVLEYAAQCYGRVVAQLVNFLDLDAVVFGGPVWPLFEQTFLDVIPAIVEQAHIFRDVHSVQVVRGSRLGADVGPIGAASLVLANTISAHPSLLLAEVNRSRP